MELLLATKNQGKVNEIKRILKSISPRCDWVISDLTGVDMPEIPETGSTFMENARLKAVSAASFTGRICLGEDSGLEVDILNGSPGIRSHRFSSSGSDQDNNLLLLNLLKGIPLNCRKARYKCAIVVAGPSGVIAESVGSTEGIIVEEPRGSNGFGYDPLFYSLEIGKTFGEATDEEKDAVSHRRRALEGIVSILEKMAG